MNWALDTAAMPAYLRVDCSGVPTIADFEAMWDEILSRDDWTPGLGVVVDNRSLEPNSDPDACTIGAIEYFSRQRTRIGDSCIALVSNASQNFKYARQFQYGIRLRGSNATLQIFNSDTQAAQWVESYCNLRSQHRTAVN